MQVHVSDEIRCSDLNKALYEHNFEIKQVNGQYVLDYRQAICDKCLRNPTIISKGISYCTEHGREALQKKRT